MKITRLISTCRSVASDHVSNDANACVCQSVVAACSVTRKSFSLLEWMCLLVHLLLLLLILLAIALPFSYGVAATDTILFQPVLSWTSSSVVPMALVSVGRGYPSLLWNSSSSPRWYHFHRLSPPPHSSSLRV